MIIAAEIGLNYDNNLDILYELIRQAKLAGADIVKLQFGWKSGPEEINYQVVRNAQKIKKWCEYWKIELMPSIFTEDALDIVRELKLNRYKIASRTVIDNPDLCKKIIAEGKETYISLGMWNKEKFPFGEPDCNHLHYIYCKSKYPTYPEDLQDFPDIFSNLGYYGYSDHMQGIEACILAIARGAQYIEKHFTLNKTSQVIRDHILSADAEELRKLVDIGKSLSYIVRETTIKSNS